MIRLTTLLAAVILLSGCVNKTVNSTSVTALDQPQQIVPENEVLDVGVAIFDPGIDDLQDDEQVYPEIRRAEATFIARELAEVLEGVGAWGAVRVVPDESQFTDLLVTGRIAHSDGERLALAVKVTDATGGIWIDKTYGESTGQYAYDQRSLSKGDPFLSVYHQIANEMLEKFDDSSPKQRVGIRQVAELRFAQSLAPEAFADYLLEDKNGIYRLKRLPAESDPSLKRVRNIRVRNYAFVDTLKGYYDAFSEEMTGPYNGWRAESYDDVVAKKELEKQARNQLIAGTVAIAAGVAAQSSSNSTTRAAGGLAGIGAGGYLLKSGMRDRQLAAASSARLVELSQDLQAEIAPRVIKLEDKTVQLNGTVQDQYEQWRELMADIYAAEMGVIPVTNGAGKSAPREQSSD